MPASRRAFSSIVSCYKCQHSHLYCWFPRFPLSPALICWVCNNCNNNSSSSHTRKKQEALLLLLLILPQLCCPQLLSVNERRLEKNFQSAGNHSLPKKSEKSQNPGIFTKSTLPSSAETCGKMVKLSEEMIVARTRVSDMTNVKKLNCW